VCNGSRPTTHCEPWYVLSMIHEIATKKLGPYRPKTRQHICKMILLKNKIVNSVAWFWLTITINYRKCCNRNTDSLTVAGACAVSTWNCSDSEQSKCTKYANDFTRIRCCFISLRSTFWHRHWSQRSSFRLVEDVYRCFLVGPPKVTPCNIYISGVHIIPNNLL